MPAVHPQRVDPLDQIVLHLCPRQAAALSLSVSDLPPVSVSSRADGDVGQCARGRITYSDVAQLAGNWTGRFIFTNKSFSLYDTFRTVKVINNFRRDLVTLVTDQSQGIDSIPEVVLHLSLRETAALCLCVHFLTCHS